MLKDFDPITVALTVLALLSLAGNWILFSKYREINEENISLKRSVTRHNMNVTTDPVEKARLKEALDRDHVR